MALKNNGYRQNYRNNILVLMSFWTNLRVLETPVHLVWALERLFGAVFDLPGRANLGQIHYMVGRFIFHFFPGT